MTTTKTRTTKSKSKKSKKSVYEIVTERIIESLEAGTVPWRKPWASALPTSMSTDKPYRGVNTFLLNLTATAEGYTSPYWGTYNQIDKQGGQVRKGEKSTLVVFWKRVTKTVEDSTTGEEVEKSWMMLRYFRVFNAEQADWDGGLPTKFALTSFDHEPIDEAQVILDGYENSPKISFGGARACYSPTLDEIQLPIPSSFTTSEEFYSTAFHEATHSTGHSSRLARDGVIENHFFGDESYAREELIAEMGAAMLAGIAGIEATTLDNSAAYLDNWIKVLRGDPNMVVSAAAAAQKSCDHILGTVFDS